MTRLRRLLGQAGEALAADLLQKNGYRILTRNYRTPFGEIDLIAQHNDNLVFIEVKLRRSGKYGSAVESITDTKRRRIMRSAQYYLQEQGALESKVRFDVFAITIFQGRPEIEIIRSAFEG